MVKKLILLVFILFILSVNSYALQEDNQINITLFIDKPIIQINNQQKNLEIAPKIFNGSTLVPLRIVTEALGSEVIWDGQLGQVKIIRGDKTIYLTIGSKIANVNNEVYKLIQEPIIQNQRTLVPIRFVSEFLGLKVNWIKAEQKIEISNDITVNKEPASNIVYLNPSNEILGEMKISPNSAKFLEVTNNEDFTAFVKNAIMAKKTSLMLTIRNTNNGSYNIKEVNNKVIGEDVLATGTTAIVDEIQWYKINNTKYVVYDIGYTPIFKEYYNQQLNTNLVKSEKELYILVKTALQNNISYFKLRTDNSSIDVKKIVNLVLEQNSEISYIDKFNYLYIENDYSLEATYKIDKDLVSARNLEVENKCKDIISKIITPSMSPKDKALAIHDYIVNNSKYDYENFKNNTIPVDSYTIYGILINGVGVCQGYSAAFNKLAKMAGLDSMCVSGVAAIDHGWNMVRIDGVVSYIDTTFDDPVVIGGGDVLKHNYFMVDKETMKKDHSWDEAKFDQKYFDYK